MEYCDAVIAGRHWAAQVCVCMLRPEPNITCVFGRAAPSLQNADELPVVQIRLVGIDSVRWIPGAWLHSC